MFWDRPHVHSDRPIWFNHSLPYLRKNDLSIRTYQVIVSFSYMTPDHFNMHEGLLDQFFHALPHVSLFLAIQYALNLPPRSRTSGTGS